MKKRLYTNLFFIAILGCFMIPQQVLALGISPNPTIQEGAANGVRIEKTVTIMRADSTSAARVKITGVGEAAKYLELPQTEFIIPAGESQSKYTFFIAPVGAPNGDHTAKIIFEKRTITNESSGGSAATMNEAIGATVRFSVTDDEIKKLEVKDIQFDEVEVGLPFVANYYLQNMGNVDARLDKIDIRLEDMTDPEHVYEVSFDAATLPLITPGASERRVATLKDRIPQGEYMAVITLYFDNKELQTFSQKIVMNPPGTLGQEANVISIDVDTRTPLIGQPIEIIGILENTGDIGFFGTFYAEVHNEEGVKVESYTSKEKFLLRSQKSEYRFSHTFSEPGAHSIKAYFEYGVQKTDSTAIDITVTAPQSEKSSMTLVYIGVGIVFILLLILFVIRFMVKRPHAAKKKGGEKYG